MSKNWVLYSSAPSFQIRLKFFFNLAEINYAILFILAGLARMSRTLFNPLGRPDFFPVEAVLLVLEFEDLVLEFWDD